MDFIEIGMIVAGLVLSAILGPFTWTDEDAALRDDSQCDFGPPTGLPQAIRGFYRHLVPWILTTAVVFAWVGRVSLGAWSAVDVFVLFGCIVAWPFLEWSFHILEHRMPFNIFGLKIDMIAARTHAMHHRNPWDPQFGITTLHNMPIFLLTLPGIWLLVLPTGPALTGTAAILTLFSLYEWVHYLIHTPFRPRGRIYRQVYRNHRHHHFQSERYWFGVTSVVADAVLQTLRRGRETPSSALCQELALKVRLDQIDDQAVR